MVAAETESFRKVFSLPYTQGKDGKTTGCCQMQLVERASYRLDSPAGGNICKTDSPEILFSDFRNPIFRKGVADGLHRRDHRSRAQ